MFMLLCFSSKFLLLACSQFSMGEGMVRTYSLTATLVLDTAGLRLGLERLDWYLMIGFFLCCFA